MLPPARNQANVWNYLQFSSGKRLKWEVKAYTSDCCSFVPWTEVYLEKKFLWAVNCWSTSNYIYRLTAYALIYF